MKLRTTKYVVKEGFINTYRNILMSLASVGVVTASLIIFGFFWVITVNVNYNTQVLREQPEMQVFCDPELDDSQVTMVELLIRGDNRIREYKTVTKQEAFEKAKEMLGEDKTVLDGLDESILPVSFVIKLKNSSDAEAVVKKFSSFPGVDNVRYSQKTIDFIYRIVRSIQIGSSLLIVLLLTISIFIISNTIKLTVFARRKEINIMKYIGATDWFIRWPFIVEGIIIGLIGAFLSLGIMSIIYSFGGGKLTEGIYMFKVVSLEKICSDLISIFSIIGVFVGALGSSISIRKYLQV